MIDKKCPKCGSRSFQINDYCVVGFIYEVQDGIVESEGTGDSCDSIKTTCVCRKCKHEWHPRNLEFTIDKQIQIIKKC